MSDTALPEGATGSVTANADCVGRARKLAARARAVRALFASEPETVGSCLPHRCPGWREGRGEVKQLHRVHRRKAKEPGLAVDRNVRVDPCLPEGWEQAQGAQDGENLGQWARL